MQSELVCAFVHRLTIFCLCILLATVTVLCYLVVKLCCKFNCLMKCVILRRFRRNNGQIKPDINSF